MRLLPVISAGFLCGCVSLHAVIAINSVTSEWTPILYGGVSDNTADNQANSPDLELVGDPGSGYHAFYVKFDDNGSASTTDGDLGFRIRVAGDKSPAGFKGYARVGLDVTGDGALDFFVSAELDQYVTIRDAGNGANNSPSTSSFDSSNTLFQAAAVSGTNYDWSPVATIDGSGTDLDGGSDPDYFLSFSISFSEIVTAARLEPGFSLFDDTYGIGYVVMTAQNSNNLNSDIGGVNNNSFNANDSWTTLGAINDPVTPDGSPVPEPSTCALLFGISAFGWVAFRRRN